MQEQNALIGVQMAHISRHQPICALAVERQPALSLQCGERDLVTGRRATQILFDGGLRGAQIDAARAVYWQSVATYRQTVLSAFQGVEDELAAIAS